MEKEMGAEMKIHSRSWWYRSSLCNLNIAIADSEQMNPKSHTPEEGVSFFSSRLKQEVLLVLWGKTQLAEGISSVRKKQEKRI